MVTNQIIAVEISDAPVLYIREKEGFVPLNDKKLTRFIPQFQDLTISAKLHKLNHWLNNEADVVCCVQPKRFLPNAKKEHSGNILRTGIKAFLAGTALFEAPDAGYKLSANALCGLHLTALQEIEPAFQPVISINSSSSEIKEILFSLVQAMVPRKHWSGKHYEIKRNAVLDYSNTFIYGISAQIQDFSRIKIRYKKHRLKTAFPYRDTVILVIGANSAQIKEATPYIEHAAVMLLNSTAGDLAPSKLPRSSIVAYDPEAITQFKAEAAHIASALRWWWGDAITDEDAWARQIVQTARASFGKPDSRYIRVEIDPQKLRNAILYQVFLSFLDEVEDARFMTSEELAPYHQGAKEVFAPVPPEPVQLRHAEDPDVFLEVMKTLVGNPPAPIVAKGERFVKKDKPMAAWRSISDQLYLVFLEDAWAKAYAKAARVRKDVDCSYFQREHWERDMQKILCEKGLIKAASSGYRYRYDLTEMGARDTTYVVAIPAQLLE